MSDTDYLAQVRARAEAATPGPWENTPFMIVHFGQSGYADCGPCWDRARPPDANPEFIAHAREDIPNLLAMIEEQDRKLQVAVGALEEAKEQCEWYRLAGTDQERHHFVAVELVDLFDKALSQLNPPKGTP